MKIVWDDIEVGDIFRWTGLWRAPEGILVKAVSLHDEYYSEWRFEVFEKAAGTEGRHYQVGTYLYFSRTGAASANLELVTPALIALLKEVT